MASAPQAVGTVRSADRLAFPQRSPLAWLKYLTVFRRESVPTPYATAGEDIGMLEKVADLLDGAADEILRLRSPPSSK
jgi:hypothetical protein